MKHFFIFMAIVTFLCGCQCGNPNAKSNETNDTSTVSESSDWDKLLNDYEKWVDQYIKTMNKAKGGDMNAFSEYSKLMEKTQAISEELEKAKGKMTTAQLKRYINITNKMTKAAAAL